MSMRVSYIAPDAPHTYYYPHYDFRLSPIDAIEEKNVPKKNFFSVGRGFVISKYLHAFPLIDWVVFQY